MAQEHRGETSGAEERPRRESVLDAVERRTGESTRVSLSHMAADDTPLTRPIRESSEFMPRKRGDYNVLGEIARGGMGRVLRAHDRDLGRDVAIKVLDPSLADRADVLQRFVEEAQIGGQLQHPGIVPVYELGLMADERPYFTMKLVKGRTLADLLATRRTPEEGRGRLLQVFESICQTVAYAHTKGVLHRDLKPANVMVGSFGEVQVVDWGLAKVLRRGGVDDELRAQRRDRTVIETVRSGPAGSDSDSLAGSVLGTPSYMPPEQARGEVESLDERADVFALGAILCQLLTGHPPYVERDGETILQQASQARLEDAYARLEASGAEPGLVALARACLAPAPGARPHNAETVARRIGDHLAETEERVRKAELEATEARVRATEERKARRLTVALALTGVLATGAVGRGWVVHERRAAQEVARIERGLYELNQQVDALQGEGRMEEASQASLSALSLVAGRDEDDRLRASAEELVARAEERARRARLEAERQARNQGLLRALDELAIAASVPLSEAEHVALDEAFGRAFREWGVDVDADVVAAVEDLRESAIEQELALALDDWAAVRRWAYGFDSAGAAQLNGLAIDLDPDEVRVALRLALIEREYRTVFDLAEDPGVLELPPSTLWVLVSALRSLRDLPGSLFLAQRASAHHPGDLRLHMATMTVARDLGLWGTAARHIGVAAAIRPDLLELSTMEAHCLGRAERYPDAVYAIERVLAETPDDPEVLRELMWTLLPLEEDGRVLQTLERLRELVGLSPEDEGMLAFVRWRKGDLDDAGFELRMDELGNPGFFGGVRRWEQFRRAVDVEDRARLLAEFEKTGNPAPAAARATVLLEQGRPREALECLEESAGSGPVRRGQISVTDASLRARAHAALGNELEARAWLEVARSTFLAIGGMVREPWEGAYLLENLRRAEDVVGD